MTEPPTIKWPGKSVTEYTDWIYPPGLTLSDDQPGNYFHAKEASPGRFTPLYISQTGDLSERLCNHGQQDCVDARGATHVHANARKGSVGPVPS